MPKSKTSVFVDNERINELFTKNGVSQAEAARKIGTSRQYVFMLCSGDTHSMNQDKLKKLAEFLSVDSEEIMFSDNNIGKRIYTLMEARNLTYREMSNIMDVEQNVLRRYISGTTIPNMVSIHRIASNFGVTEKWLLGK